MQAFESQAVRLSRRDLEHVFHGLAGLAGEAITERAVQCAISFQTKGEGDEPAWNYGHFALQAAGEAPDRPGVKLIVDARGNGVYAETSRAIADWESPESPLDVWQNGKQLSAQTILRRTRDIVAAAPPLRSEGPLGTPEPSSFMPAHMPGPKFAQVLGQLLLFAREDLRYLCVGAVVDSGSGVLGGQPGHPELLSASNTHKGAAVTFRLEHLHTRPEPEPLQAAFLSCYTLAYPRRGSQILYAYDGLRTVHDQLYRVRETVTAGDAGQHPAGPPVFAQPTDIPELARSALDPGAYLQRYWPTLLG